LSVIGGIFGPTCPPGGQAAETSSVGTFFKFARVRATVSASAFGLWPSRTGLGWLVAAIEGVREQTRSVREKLATNEDMQIELTVNRDGAVTSAYLLEASAGQIADSGQKAVPGRRCEV
jgi:hypothetical protein